MIKILKKAFRIFRDTVTVRPLRKYIVRKIYLHKMRHTVQEIESEFDNNTVLIFQYQMFDTLGEKCYNGGAERYVTDLADILTSHGYTPILIQMGDTRRGIWTHTMGKLKIIGMPTPDYLTAISLFRKYKFVIYSGATNWGKKLHPNILISHGITWDITDENVDIKSILKRFLDVDKFVSVDTNTISWLRTTFAKTLHNMDANYVPNYVDTKIYHPTKRAQNSEIRITFPRRAAPERGYWLMSTALPPIMEKYPNVIFDFVGFAHGPEINNDIKRLIKMFPGRVNHYAVGPDQMPEIYQRTDISLVPTIYAEGTSLSALEAMATGNIVIATNIGGLPNLIIDGYNGILINPSDTDLRTALDRVLANAELREKLSKNAINVATAFDKEIWKQRWDRIIDKMS